MKKAFAFLMCTMMALFFTVTTAQSKSEVGSNMGVPTICNLESNYISNPAGNIQVAQFMQNWGLLYRQVNFMSINNLNNPENFKTRYLDVLICHYDPGWKNNLNTFSDIKNKNMCRA